MSNHLQLGHPRQNSSSSLASTTRMILGEDYYVPFLSFMKQIFLLDQAAQACKNDLSDSACDPNAIPNRLVLFVTRRLSCLADIFFRILRNEINYDGSSSSRYITNSALINAADYLAGLMSLNIRSGKSSLDKVPEILIVDDSISYGRALVNILNVFKNRLIRMLKERDMYGTDAESLAEQLIQEKVSIRIFMKKTHLTLLPRGFAYKMEAVRTEKDCVWNDYSNRISELINHVDVANAAFILSAGCNEIPKSCKGWDKIETVYQDKKETTFFHLLGAIPAKDSSSREAMSAKAVVAIRFFACVGGETPYRAVPFLFLPKLELSDLNHLEDQLFTEQMKQLLSERNDQQYFGALDSYRKTTTERSRLEFLTMYCSHSLLLDFFKECETLNSTIPLFFDAEKIGWNYDDIVVKGNRKALLQEQGGQNKLLESSYWTNAVQIDKALCRCSFPAFDCNAFPEKDQDEKRIMDDFISQYEWYCFVKGIEAEQKARELIMLSGYPSNWQCVSKDPERREPFPSVIKALQISQNKDLALFFSSIQNIFGDDFLSVETDKKLPVSFFQFLAITLQLMDAGIISLVTEVKYENFYNTNRSGEYRTYTSMEQVLRFCEQSLAIWPKKMALHLDVLNLINKEFDWTPPRPNADYARICDQQIAPAVERYRSLLYSSDEPDLAKISMLTQTIIFGLQMFKCASQKIVDWTLGMEVHYVITEDESNRLPDLKPAYSCEIGKESDAVGAKSKAGAMKLYLHQERYILFGYGRR